MTSSTKSRNTIELVLRVGQHPERTANASPHEELANANDSGKAQLAFLNRWGPLLTPPDGHDAFAHHLEFENRLSDELLEEAFRAFGGGLFSSLRNSIREAWKTDPLLLNKIQSPDGDDRKDGAWLESIPQALLEIHDAAARFGRTTWRFKGSRIEVIPDDLWVSICILFLRDHAAGRTAICANPHCSNPFFLKRRSVQKYCEAGPCVEYAQRQYALSWWRTKGKKIRQQQQARSKNKKREAR